MRRHLGNDHGYLTKLHMTFHTVNQNQRKIDERGKERKGLVSGLASLPLRKVSGDIVSSRELDSGTVKALRRADCMVQFCGVVSGCSISV